MSTKSFLKDITIKNSIQANQFIDSLEKAENKKSKIVKFSKKVTDIKDKQTIIDIFKK